MAHAGKTAADALTWVGRGKAGPVPESLRGLSPRELAEVTRAAAECKNAIRGAAARATRHR